MFVDNFVYKYDSCIFVLWSQVTILYNVYFFTILKSFRVASTQICIVENMNIKLVD